MAKFNPRKIRGTWTEGYVLDVHSTGSTLIGHNEFGHPLFDTHRTEIGELLYHLKYRHDEAMLSELTDAAEKFIRSWKVRFSAIVPVPATRVRKVQPVVRLAEELGNRFKVPVLKTAVRKQKRFAELKNVYDPDERRRLLGGAFVVTQSLVQKQRILLVDDLYRSGATLNAITEVLLGSGAQVVYAFALTRTRSKV